MDSSIPNIPPPGFAPPGGISTPPLLPQMPPIGGFPSMISQFTVPPPGFGNFPPPGAASQQEQWSEHKAPDGRTYYYNSVTKQSLWQKPDVLKTPAELLLSQCPWKEYTTDNGKIYYNNVNTKESRWTIPPELEEIKNKIAAEEKKNISASATPTDVVSPLPTFPVVPGLPAALPTVSPNIATSNASPGGKSALEASMAATLAAISIPVPPPKNDEDSNASTHSEIAKDSRNSTPEPKVYRDKKEAMEAFKELLKDNNVPSNATWEQCIKIIQHDPRYESLKRFNERKQVFNAYKTQKQKDEKEENRLKAKKSKENLEQFLLTTDKITSATKYYKCDEMFSTMDLWNAVNDSDRRDIYEDVMFTLAKREKEEGKVLKKRNMKKLREVLDNMMEIKYDTTWNEAQSMLLGNDTFKNDVSLLAMDKEDALIAFEEHIRELEKEEVEEREREKKRQKRQCRKNRDQFINLLNTLHEEGKLTSMSLWVELYPIISADVRFSAMLGQTGSTPLDLFKFYVENLKGRFHDEKRIIKEILKNKEFEVKVDTTFEQFATVVCEDKKSSSLDAGNVKLTYNSLLEKAEAKEKERLKEENKRIKKLENDFKKLLREMNVNFDLPWDEVRGKLENEEEFQAFASDSERSKVYKDFQHEMEESCSHHHSRSRKSKKSKKNKKYKSSSNSDSESEKKKKHRSRSVSPVSEDSAEEYKKRKPKKKHKKKSPSFQLYYTFNFTKQLVNWKFVPQKKNLESETFSYLSDDLDSITSSKAIFDIKWKDAIRQLIATCIVNLLSVQIGINMSYSSVLLPQLEREDSAIFVDESEKTWIASIMTLTLMIGSIVAGPLMDAFGRKFVNILTAIPYILGWTVQACAVEVWHIYVARLLAGLGGGLTTASTVYVSEITHHHFRPMLLSLTSVFTSIGILLTCLIGMSINWRTMSIIFCLMAIVSMLLIFLTPKSPPWLLTFRDDYEGAEVATRWLYTNLEIFHWQFHLFKSHKSKLHEEILQKPFRERLLGVWRTYRRPEVIKPTIILFFLFVFQQLSGGYVIIFYAVYLFDKLEGNSSATLDEYLALVLLGAIRFVMSFISAILSKYIGRRPLLITSAFGMSVSSLICGLYLYKTHLKGNYNTYYALACILTYICFCALGFLVIPWTLLCEVLPLKVRGTLSGLLMAIAYLLMFGVVKIFLFILNSYKIHSIFFAISLLNLIAVGFVYLWIPETLKKTLGEIEDHFRKSSY